MPYNQYFKELLSFNGYIFSNTFCLVNETYNKANNSVGDNNVRYC